MNNLITVNLLSPEKKRMLKKYLLILFLKNFAAYSFVLIAVVGIVLLVSQTILTTTFNDTISRTALVTREYGGVNALIREANRKLRKISEIESEFTPWSEVLIHAATLTPSNITLVSLSCEASTRDVLIRGVAKTRGDLLIMTRAFEESKIFESVESPIANLLIKEDILFDLKMKVSQAAIAGLKVSSK